MEGDYIRKGGGDRVNWHMHGFVHIRMRTPSCSHTETGHMRIYIQRNKLRRMYKIDISDAPLGEYCDGKLHDFCVVQMCPCLAIMQVY